MKLRLNAHAQYEYMDFCAETKSKKCASDKNSLPGRVWPRETKQAVGQGLVVCETRQLLNPTPSY